MLWKERRRATDANESADDDCDTARANCWVIQLKQTALLILIGHFLSGCSDTSVGSVGAPVTKVTTKASTYHEDISDSCRLVATYVRYWEREGEWPSPGMFQTKDLIYKDSEDSSAQFPDRRRDFHRTLHDGGKELDVILWNDGRIEVKTFSADFPITR